MKESYVTKNISIKLHIPLLCSMQFFKTILFCKCKSPEKLLFINDQKCNFPLIVVVVPIHTEFCETGAFER